MLLDDVKLAIRMSNTAYDTDIMDLIEEAKADMVLAGIVESAIVETDPLIKRAIKTYCKANFGLNNPDSLKLQQSYEALRNHLSMSIEYNGGDIVAV